MAIEATQMRDLIKRTLSNFDRGILSADAIELLMLTFAAESHLGSYLKDNYTAGIGQMTKGTFNWLREKYQDRWPILKYCHYEQLEYNLRIAIIFSRLRYLPVNKPLPDRRDKIAMAEYWKKHYNTPIGAGTVEQAVKRYEVHVGGIEDV